MIGEVSSMSKNRKDGVYIKPKDSVHAIMPYLMETRIECEVSKTVFLDITELVKWIDRKNEKLDFKYTYFQGLAAIFSKVIYNREYLNRFVQGHRMYQRNYVSISFIAKDKLSDKAEEKIVFLKIDPKETGVELAHRMAVDIFKTKSEGTNDMDKTLKALTKFPRWLMRIIVRFIKWLDYHGWVPDSLTSGDSNYSTLLLSNLGSIKCDSCYHHLNNYGTNSIVITIGTIKEEKGKYTVDITATLDERIADGFYFAKSMKLAQEIASNPKYLEDSMDAIIEFDYDKKK